MTKILGNVCASLPMLGDEATYLTALPQNSITESFFAQMRGLGVFEITNLT